MAAPLGLHRVRTEELQRLVRAIHRGHFSYPLTRAGLVLAGFGDLEAHLDALVGRDRAGAVAVVAALLQERAAAEHGRSQSAAELELLWRAPAALAPASLREPLILASELIVTATRSILWSGLPTAARSPLLNTLHAAQRGRQLAVSLLLVGAADSAAVFMREVFVHGEPRPECHVAEPGQPLPPSCLIADEEQVLLFSSDGDLLDGEESGALRVALAARHAGLARTLVAQLQQLRDQVPYRVVLA